MPPRRDSIRWAAADLFAPFRFEHHRVRQKFDDRHQREGFRRGGCFAPPSGQPVAGPCARSRQESSAASNPASPVGQRSSRQTVLGGDGPGRGRTGRGKSAASCRVVSIEEKSASSLARPARPREERRAGSRARVASASAKAGTSPGAARSPVCAWSTISGTPASRVETTGLPAAMASRMTVGNTSHAPFFIDAARQRKHVAGRQVRADFRLWEQSGQPDAPGQTDVRRSGS